MTEKSKELSDKDKVTQDSASEEQKSIAKENQPEAEVQNETEEEKVEAEEVAEESPEVKGESTEEPIADAKTEIAENKEVEVETPTSETESPKELEKETTSSSEESPGVKTEKTSSEKSSEENPVAEESSSDNDNEESAEEEDHQDEIDLSTLSKSELLALVKSKVSEGNSLKTDKFIHEIKSAFEEFTSKEKAEALEKFKAEGGSEDDFDFRPSDEEKEFNQYFYQHRQQVIAIRKESEKQKEHNLNAKTELLNKLRDLVDGEETTLSMSTIKGIQEEWKSIGPVPSAQNRNLWASFNALMDRFYDNRSIYFELKELDRKKNLESKLELCEKAEALKDVKDLTEAIKSLNELHEEFKHIGPVPRDEQEPLWQRFKSASDAVYDRRKDFYEGQKEEFKKNQEQKEVLIKSLGEFAGFKAERIRDWNTKTKEILEIQKAWEIIGPVPRESGKEINKAFWAAFKQFFHNKNLFFKELDEIRAGNQTKAEELIQKAEELKDNTDWQNTANAFIKLQQDWKKLGPTPEKGRDALYKRFKLACDTFFENRRNSNKQSNAEFEENLKKKQGVCQKITTAAAEEEVSEDALTALVSEFNEIGFVPRKSMKQIQAEFKTAVDAYLEKLNPNGEGREDFLFRLNLNRIQSDPNSVKTLNKKEHGIRKQISELENNITLWKNNLEFFASSKTADKLKDQFDVKIQKAEEEVDKLKKKLSILREF